MHWKKFLLYNALGGISWVIAIAAIGFLFSDKFTSLTGFIKKVSWESREHSSELKRAATIVAIIVAVSIFVYSSTDVLVGNRQTSHPL